MCQNKQPIAESDDIHNDSICKINKDPYLYPITALGFNPHQIQSLANMYSSANNASEMLQTQLDSSSFSESEKDRKNALKPKPYQNYLTFWYGCWIWPKSKPIDSVHPDLKRWNTNPCLVLVEVGLETARQALSSLLKAPLRSKCRPQFDVSTITDELLPSKQYPAIWTALHLCWFKPTGDTSASISNTTSVLADMPNMSGTSASNNPHSIGPRCTETVFPLFSRRSHNSDIDRLVFVPGLKSFGSTLPASI